MQVVTIYATKGAMFGKVLDAMNRCQQDRLLLLEPSEELNMKVHYFCFHILIHGFSI